MSALEAQIMEIVARMDEGRKRRMLALAQELETEPHDHTASWLDDAAAFRRQLREQYGENFSFGIQAALDEVREERLNDDVGSH